MPRARSDRASAVPLLAALILVLTLMTAAVGRLGSATVLRARSDAIADVTALAAADGGDVAAGRVAEANHATVRDLVLRPDGSTAVTVRSGGVTSRAAARMHSR